MRIIAGSLKSRVIRAPRGQSTRPTSDRVREALFAILGDLTGMRVLDLYAGSGALSFEAISRGASHAVCIDTSREAVQTIRENAQILGVSNKVQIFKMRVQQAGQVLKNELSFDQVFIDPPYADVNNSALSKEFDVLYSQAPTLLNENSLVACEHASRDTPPIFTTLQFQSTRTWGDTSISFYVRNSNF